MATRPGQVRGNNSARGRWGWGEWGLRTRGGGGEGACVPGSLWASFHPKHT